MNTDFHVISRWYLYTRIMLKETASWLLDFDSKTFALINLIILKSITVTVIALAEVGWAVGGGLDGALQWVGGLDGTLQWVSGLDRAPQWVRGLDRALQCNVSDLVVLSWDILWELFSTCVIFFLVDRLIIVTCILFMFILITALCNILFLS